MLRLTDATWTDVRDASVDLALLPVGSTEQHGPHAPLGTDTLTAEAIAERGAAVVEDRSAATVACGPPLPVGVAAEHRAFDGTLHVPPDAFRAYVRGTVASLRSAVDAPVVIVNGHGGNTAALDEVAAELTRDGGHRVVAHTWFAALDRYPDAMGHGGPVETAVLRHLYPEHLADDRVPDASDGAADRWGTWAGGTNVAHDVDTFTANGVVGDPDALSAEAGREIVDEGVEQLAVLAAAVIERA